MIIAALAKKGGRAKVWRKGKKSRPLDPLFFLWCQNFGISGRYDCLREKDPAPPFLTAGGRRRKRAGSPHQQYPSAPTTTLSVGGGPPLPPLPFLLFLPANARGSPFLGRRKRKRERGDREDGPSSRMGTPPKKKTGKRKDDPIFAPISLSFLLHCISAERASCGRRQKKNPQLNGSEKGIWSHHLKPPHKKTGRQEQKPTLFPWNQK